MQQWPANRRFKPRDRLRDRLRGQLLALGGKRDLAGIDRSDQVAELAVFHYTNQPLVVQFDNKLFDCLPREP
jgi:hypothetical protein